MPQESRRFDLQGKPATTQSASRECILLNFVLLGNSRDKIYFLLPHHPPPALTPQFPSDEDDVVIATFVTNLSISCIEVVPSLLTLLTTKSGTNAQLQEY